MSRPWPRRDLLRRLALLAPAAIGIHQLRYLLGGAPEGDHALDASGHAYLDMALPLVVSGAIALIALTFVAAAQSAHRGTWRAAPLADWLTITLALTAVFALQELAEGVMLAGQVAAPQAMAADGGWLVLPLAGVFAALVLLGLRLLDSADRAVVALAAEPSARDEAEPRTGCPDFRPRPLRPLAFGLARRPPPAPALTV